MCNDSSDEKNCSDDRFYCEVGDPLYVRATQTFDGRQDCSDWSDECPMLNRSSSTDPFSSRYEMISNPILRSFVWIMGILALIGNSAVILHEARKLKNPGRTNAVITANRLMVLNLAVADFLMGVFLLILGIKSSMFQGYYCSEDLGWRSSTQCINLGILSVLSCETSVITMVFLTGMRLHTIFKPFQTDHPRKRFVLCLILISWFVSIILAMIPLLPRFSHLFVTKTQFRDNIFVRKSAMNLVEARELFTQLFTYDRKENASLPENFENYIQSLSWEDMEMGSENFFRRTKMIILKKFGYYSINSVCIPKFFVSTSDPAWKFSFGINLFNFLAFVFVASACVGMYFKTKKVSGAVKNKATTEQLRLMQRKILRLIITDFCCWVPICIMAFLQIGGVKIGPTAYVVAAIVLLPINSALNPLLYSNLIERCFHARKRASATSRSTVTSTSSFLLNRGSQSKDERKSFQADQ